MLAAVTERQDGAPRFLSFMDIPEAGEFDAEARRQSLNLELLGRLDLPLVPDFVERGLGDLILDQLLRSQRYRQLFSFVERGGLYAGTRFLDWIREKLASHGIGADDTLEQFAARTGGDLSVVASDTTAREMLVLNHRTAPNLPVAWAVRMSMSIPFVWQEVRWRAAWDPYRGASRAGHYVVDGGLLSNFPIRLITSPRDRALRAENRDIMGRSEMRGAEVLGLLIDETLPVPGEPEVAAESGRFSRLRTARRVSRLVDTMMGAHDRQMIQLYRKKICSVPAKGFGTLEFDLQGSRLENFLEGGRQAMRDHLAARGLGQ